MAGGIDVAGYRGGIQQRPVPAAGTEVLANGSGLSESRDGGYSEYSAPGQRSSLPLPAGLSHREAMGLGTAGFTAATVPVSHGGQRPKTGDGPIVVTGASGGRWHRRHRSVDLGRLRSPCHHRQGRRIRLAGDTSGPASASPAMICTGGKKPLDRTSWAGCIDNVGGDMLAGISRSLTCGAT